MDKSNFEYYLKHLDRTLYYLDKPNLYRDDNNNIKQFGLAKRICLFVSQIFKRIARIWNYIFGDHYGYNELKARQIIIHYINRAPTSQRTAALTRQILALYDRLHVLREGNNCYTSKINLSKIMALRDSLARVEKHQKESCKVDNSSYLASTEPAEIIPDEPDDAALAHHFVHINGLEAPSARMLMHLHGNSFGRNSRLEGSESANGSFNAMGYLKKYLTAWQQHHAHPAVDSFLKQLDSADALQKVFTDHKGTVQRISEDSKTAANKLSFSASWRQLEQITKDKEAALALARKNSIAVFTSTAQARLKAIFDQNGSLIIPGGWSGPQAHSLYYEVIAESNATATLRIYDSRAGSHNSAAHGNRFKYQPYTEWKGISKENLMGNSFLNAVAEMQLNGIEANYGRNDIYKALKNILQPQSTDEGQHPTILMSKETARVGAMRGLFGMLRTCLEKSGPGGKAVYKRFKCDIRMQSLFDAISNPVTSKELNALGLQRLAQKSFQKTCRAIDKLYNKKILSEEYVAEAMVLLQKNAFAITHEEHPKIELSKLNYSSPFLNPTLPRLQPSLEATVKAGTVVTVMHNQGFIVDQLRLLPTSDAQQIAKTLAEVQKIGEAAWKEEGADQALHTGLLYTINKLSTEESFWKAASQGNTETVKQLMQAMGSLASLFFKTCYTLPQADIILPERIHALMRVQLILRTLTSQLNYNINFWGSDEPHYFATKPSYFILGDSKSDKDLHEFNPNRNTGSWHVQPNTASIHGSLNSSYSGELQASFYPQMSASFPQIVRAIAPEAVQKISKASGFASRTEHAQNARIYASEELPEWIKSLRNTNLYMNLLLRSSVAKPASIDRTQDLTLNLEVNDSTDSSRVKITVGGVDVNTIQNQSAIAKAIHANTSTRFEYMHGTFSSEALRDLMRKIVENASTEKKIISDQKTAASLKLSNEECQELRHIFSDPATQIPEAIEFFTKHPEQLKNRDYQIFFRIAIFDPRILCEALKHEGLAQALELFIARNLELWSAQNEIQGSVFLIQCNRLLHKYAPKRFPNALSRLRLLLARHGIEPEEKSLIYTEMIAHFANIESDQLQDEDLADLIAGITYLQQTPVPKKWLDPFTNSEVRKAPYLHAGAIRNYLSPGAMLDDSRLNLFLKTLQPSATDTTWTNHSANSNQLEFHSNDGRYQLRPLEGLLIDTQQTEMYLPLEIRHHPHFTSLFSGIERAKRIADGVYTFTHNTRTTYVALDSSNAGIRIEQNDNGKLLRFIPPETFLNNALGMQTSHLGSRHLAQEFSHWQPIDEPNLLLFRNPCTDAIEYQASISSRTWIERITRIADSRVLNTTDLLKEFEDPAYVHAWYDSQNRQPARPRFGLSSRAGTEDLYPSFQSPYTLAEIELPRFGLSFKNVAGKLRSVQFEGYSIAINRTVQQLGSYKHYLVLENEDGDKKVLLPQQDLVAMTGEKGDVFETTFSINRHLEQGDRQLQRFLSYDLNLDGKLTSRSLEANLYLVQTLLAAQEYEAAAQLLKRQGRKLSAYNKREAYILSEICSQQKATKDFDGNAASIRTYAGYLLLKNGSDHQKRYDQNLEAIAENALEYVNKYRNATFLHLEPHEEIFLLSTLLQEGFDPIAFLRLRELDPDAARAVVIPSGSSKRKRHAKQRQKHVPIQNLIPYMFWGNAIDFSVPDTSTALFTRLKPELKGKFWQYYTLALQGTNDEKQWLRDSLHFLSASSDAESRTFSQIFTCLLDHPTQFSLPPITQSTSISSNESNILNDWRDKMIDVLKQQIAANVQPTRSVPSPLINLTPQNFRLNQITPPTPVSQNVAPNIQAPQETWAKICSDWFQERVQPAEIYDKEFGEWLKERVQATQDSDMESQAYATLQADFEALQKQTPPKQYALKTNVSLSAIRKTLKSNPQDAVLEALQFEILEIANKMPSEENAKNRELLAKMGTRRRPITLERTIVCFAVSQQHPELLRTENPFLEDNDLLEINALVSKYLLIATHEQQRKRALDTLERLEKLESSTTVDLAAKLDLQQQLANDLMAQHCHDANSPNPAVVPHYLAFEYFAGVLLRPEQVMKIEEFLHGGNLNIIMEMLMGFGKSKVLVPLLALLLKKALIIVPPSLFENVSSDTQRILQDAFGSTLHSLHFERSTTFTVTSLRNLLRNLTTAQERGECNIMTSKSLQCLLLKFIEMTGKQFKEFSAFTTADGTIELEWPEELQLMQKILNSFDVNAVIDEADSVLSVLRKICFSMGLRTSPPTFESATIAKILNLLYQNPTLKALARLESDPQPDPAAPVLTEADYDARLKRPLAEAIVKIFAGNLDVNSPTHTKALADFSTTLSNPVNREKLVYYICRDQEHRSEGQAFYDAQNKEVREVLSLASQVNGQFLAHTLTRVCSETYGVDSDSRSSIAVPFLATNKPSTNSQFANRNITMLYTFQAIVKKGISKKMVVAEIERIQSQAMRELREEGAKITIEKTHAWRNFELLRGTIPIPLFNFKPDQLTALIDSLNASIESKMAFVDNIVIPQLELYEEQSSCNPSNLSSFLPNACGFTGTLRNGGSIHRKHTLRPASGIAAKTLEIIFRNSRDAIVTLNEQSTKQMLDQLSNTHYDVIIDAGGYFKQGSSNLEIAREIAKYHNKHVVFYNSSGEQTITDGDHEMALSQSTVNENNRITFLDQDHTIGADVKYKRDAVGLVTVGRNMPESAYSQGSWRLRGLDKLQRIVSAISTDVQSMIKQANGNPSKIRAEHIFHFTIANQAHAAKPQYFQAFFQQLWDIPQQILLKILRNESIAPAQYQSAFEALKDLWIKSGCLSTDTLYGKIPFKRPKLEIVQEEEARCKKFLSELYDRLPWIAQADTPLQDKMDAIDALHEHIVPLLPDEIVHPEQDTEQAVELEQEQEVEQELENQLETQNERQEENISLDPGRYGNYQDFRTLTSDVFGIKNKTPRFNLSAYLEHDPELASSAAAFNDVDISLNAFSWTEGGTPTVQSLQLFGQYRTPLHFVDVQGDRVTILSQKDVSARSDHPGIYNLSFGYCNRADTTLSAAARKKIVKIKFINGEAHYSKVELRVLEEWLQEAGPSLMREFFISNILSGFPCKTAAYQHSPLQRLFSRLTE